MAAILSPSATQGLADVQSRAQKLKRGQHIETAVVLSDSLVANLERADLAPSTRIEAVGKKDCITLRDQQVGHRLMSLRQAIAPRGGAVHTAATVQRDDGRCLAGSMGRRDGRPEIKRTDRDRLSRLRVDVEALETDSLSRRLGRMREGRGAEQRGAK